jgi:hypothetical protein
MTATSQITARMAAALKQRTEHLTELTSIGRQATKRHDEIAAGKGKLSPEARDSALNGLQATADYCRSMVGAAAG